MNTKTERRYKILIVDDESAIRERYSDFFRKREFDVETANDGREGLQKLITGAFDVAIVDIHMPPHMNGIEMIRKAKAAGVDTSMIIIAGHGERDQAVEALNIGVDYWFNKSSINLDDLLTKVIELAQVISMEEVQQILSAIPDEE